MLKKMISVLLAVVLVVSAIAITSISFNAATYNGVELESNKLYFDTAKTGWDMAEKDKVGFYVFSSAEGAEIDWGGKKLLGSKVDGTDSLWEYDPEGKGMTLNAGVQYKIIFYHAVNNAATEQTYDLIFDTTCLGHAGYCNGTTYENPVDSSKTALAAFWDGKNSSQYGPVLQISSIGNVVGTCLEEGKTKLSVFTDFISVVSADSGKTGLDNSREYVVKPGTKTEQKLIDDIGTDLGLTADEVQSAFTSTGVATEWSYDASTLKKAAQPTQAPTKAPTQAPTQAPTKAPTQAPTQAPTKAPTQAPTTAPQPTQGPTTAPQPTQGPTTAPQPTQGPTTAPQPTQGPTTAPQPTDAPQPQPTDAPQPQPTDAPQPQPTDAPQPQPTDAPQPQPTEAHEYVRGNATGSGKTDVDDVTWIQRYIVKLITPSEIYLDNADADLDGVVDIIDASLIQRVLAGICNWDKVPTNG